jgi:hypothetical protein
MRKIFCLVMMLCVGISMRQQPMHAMGTLSALGVSVLKSEFVKNHARDFGVVIAAVLVVTAYRSFFKRLDRIEIIVEEIKKQLGNAPDGFARIDASLKAAIESVLEKLAELPHKEALERMLLELRNTLAENLKEQSNKNAQQLADFEAKVRELLAKIEKNILEKLVQLEQIVEENTVKVEQNTKLVQAYQADFKSMLKQANLKQVVVDQN